MARKSNLSVVTAETPAPPKKLMTVEQAAKSGTHLDLLEAMGARIASAVSDVNCPPRDLAALTRRLQEIAKEISAIDAAAKQEADENDEVADEAFDTEAL